MFQSHCSPTQDGPGGYKGGGAAPSWSDQALRRPPAPPTHQSPQEEREMSEEVYR